MSKVKVFLEDGRARFKGYLGSGGDLPRFQKALDGARYDRNRGGRLATFDKVPPILDRLRTAGFDVVMSKELEEMLERMAIDRWNDRLALRDRIAAVDAEIFAITGDRLFSYQKSGAEWLFGRVGALLCDDQGVGKTRTAIVAAPKNAPILVICNSGAKFVWAGEMAKCRPNIRTRVLQGTDSFRWPRDNEMVIINYDVLPNIHDREGTGKGMPFFERLGGDKRNHKKHCDGELVRQPCPGCKEQLVVGRPPPQGSGPMPVSSIQTVMGHKPSCDEQDNLLPAEPCPGCHELLEACLPGTVVIGDEAHYIKSPKSNRSRRYKAIARAARDKGGRTWNLTGTPMENEAKELWTVMDAAGVAEEAFGNFDVFSRLFKRKEGFWGATWGMPGDEDVPEIVDRARRVMLRRMKKDVQSELPSKLYQQLIVPVDRAAMAACDSYLKNFGGVDHICELIEKEKFDFKSMAAARAALATAKIPAMLEIIAAEEENGEPLIVFSAHRAPIDTIAKLPGWKVITGSETAEQKAKAVELFQAGKLKGLGLTIPAGGTAITLTRGCRQLWVDRMFTPSKNIQAEDRQHRYGQKNTVVIMSMVAEHPLDRRVDEIVLKKQKLIAKSVDAAAVKDDETLTAQERDLARRVDALQVSDDERRSPDDGEKNALEKLRDLVFDSRFYEKTAQNLAEEADTIGLSAAQWGMINELTKYGIPGARSKRKDERDTEETCGPA